MILGPIQCSFCEYPQLHKFIKWQQNTSAGQILYRALCLHIYVGGNIYLERDMEQPGSSAHLPKRTGCTLCFFRISASTILNCAFNNSGLNSKKKFNKKNGNFEFFKGYIYTRGISPIINAPKRRRSAGNGNSRVM